MMRDAPLSQIYFQKGFGLKAEVGPILERTYQSEAVERLKTLGYEASVGGIHLKLAREFGFCYGVDRAVDYAYQTRRRFPDRQVFLTGEIIHNPDVNMRLRDMGIRILEESTDPGVHYADVRAGDVVILPAFGVPVQDMPVLQERGCVLVDTTCGSVLNVWKKVHFYARDGFTVIIHGKHYHEETRATASQASLHPGGRYLCVRDLADTEVLASFIRGEIDAAAIRARFAAASSPGFDPDVDLQRIGLANQTTMLMTETLQVQERLRRAIADRYGEAAAGERFRAFDTICSATQERQDAVSDLLDAGGLDVMIVIGGYNSSNTQALARMCDPRVPTFYIDSAACVDADAIRHRPVGAQSEIRSEGWLPQGSVTVGLTAGASTPDRVVGDVLERILAARGCTLQDMGAAAVGC
jgi:4-hydroxy-3-methylbut-2-enyl diphosphate reductase